MNNVSQKWTKGVITVCVETFQTKTTSVTVKVDKETHLLYPADGRLWKKTGRRVTMEIYTRYDI